MRSSILLFGLLLLGCASAVAQQPDTEITGPVPTTKVDENSYNYDPAGRRDPFTPLMQERRPVTATPGVPLEPLEKFELDQLNLKAVLLGFDAPRAMVSAPDGKSYIVTIGDKVGKNRGVITDVTKSEVTVIETYVEFTGDIRTSVKQIKLPERKGI